MHLGKVRRLLIVLFLYIRRFFSGDDMTLHAGRFLFSLFICLCIPVLVACPVLIGNKWIANKWIHERGQEFRRPCSLDPMAWRWKIYYFFCLNIWTFCLNSGIYKSRCIFNMWCYSLISFNFTSCLLKFYGAQLYFSELIQGWNNDRLSAVLRRIDE
jgi:hypothetical protein